MESPMWVATYLKSSIPVPSSITLRYWSPRDLPRTIEMFRAWASIEFSTNSAIALRGLFCERAMMRIAFHWFPIRRRPWLRSRFVVFRAAMGIVRVPVTEGRRNGAVWAQLVRPWSPARGLARWGE